MSRTGRGLVGLCLLTLVENKRKYTYQPPKKQREDSGPLKFEMQFDDSVEYVDPSRARVNISSQFTDDQLRITNISTDSVIDLKSSFGLNKYEDMNESYDTFSSGSYT